MLKHLFSRPLALTIGGQSLRFRSPADLDAALDARTSLNPQRIAALMDLRDEALRRYADKLQDRLQYFFEALSRCSQEADGAGHFLAGLDPAQISEDHDWRTILRVLGTLDGEFEGYKRAALGRYVQYLDSVREIVSGIHANRQHDGEGAARERDAKGDTGARQTLIFTAALPEALDANAGDFRQLAKGEPYQVRFGPHQSLELILARYRFHVVSGDPYLLVDDHGGDARIRRGLNVVGRSSTCEVVVHAGYRAVSRRHLSVEIAEDGLVTIIDLSSGGTYVVAQT